jgi:hypothetical protein
MTGKLRMLSHQVVMCSLLHEEAAQLLNFKETQSNALSEFEKIVKQITDPGPKHGLSQATANVLIASGVVTAAHAKNLEHFVTRASALKQTRDKTSTARLGEFAATSLLQTLNTLISNIRHALDQQIVENQKNQEPLLRATATSLKEITQLSKTLQIVSMNASLETQRAGDGGAAFGEIAREMRMISNKGAEHAAKLKQDLDIFKTAHVTATGRPI